MSPWREEVIAHTRNIIKNINSITKILELGCDDGAVSCLLAKEFPNIYFEGMDYRREAIAMANKEKNKENIKNVSFLYEYFFNMDIDAKYKSYDIIIFSEVYEHLIAENQILSLRIIGNLLKEKGYIVFTIPNCHYIFNKLEKNYTFNTRYPNNFYDDLTQTSHWLEPSYEEISKIFVSLGFDLIEHSYFNIPRRRYKILAFCEKLLKKVPFLRRYLLQNQYVIGRVNERSILLKQIRLF